MFMINKNIHNINMKYLNYYSHILLTSKYKIVTNLIIYLLIYIIITNNQIAFCMNENIDIPEIAEVKQTTQILRTSVDHLIHKQIEEFVGYKEIIDQQALQIKFLEEKLESINKELIELKDQEPPVFYNQYNEPIPYPLWEDYGIRSEKDY